MLSREAAKSAVQVAILAGASLFLGLPSCVVAENVTIVGNGSGGVDLGDPFVSGGRSPGATIRKTPTPRPASRATQPPNATPAPTLPPVITRADLAADFWVRQESGVTVDLHGVVAVPSGSSAKVWAVGDEGTILFSPDAGKTWQKQESGTTKALYSVAYDITPGILLVGGADGTLLLTTDSGSTWTKLPTPVASQSADAPGAIRQVDIWTVGTRGRRAPFISTERFPLLGAPDVRKVFEDDLDPPLPRRDRSTWDFALTSADTPTRFGFYYVSGISAYGLVALADRTGAVCNAPVCIGFPDVGDLNNGAPWKWRRNVKFDGKDSPEGNFTDLALVPDPGYECAEYNAADPLPAYLSTDKAIYRTADYGKTWKKIPNGPQGAMRIHALGLGRIVAITATRIWHGTANFPLQNCNSGTKGDPVFQWAEVVLQAGDIDLDYRDQFFGAVKSATNVARPPDMWMVGRGGKILFRKGAL